LCDKRHQSKPYSTELFTRKPEMYFPYFPEVDETCVYFFGMLSGFRKFAESGNLFCNATAATKTALGVSSLGSVIFVASWHAPFLGD